MKMFWETWALLLAALAVIVLILLIQHAHAQSFPDSSLTPGVVLNTDPAVVCAPGYDRTHRVWHDKAQTLQRYGIDPARAREFEDDDRVPVCAGADNSDPRNHWPQPCASWSGDACISGEAADKDHLEWRVCAAVCHFHTMTLDEAQKLFLGDWRGELGK